MTAECSVECCERPMRYRGLCDAHAHRRREGRPLDSPVRPYRVDVESLLDKTGSCWLYTGRINHGGYGHHWSGLVHRLMYERHVGPIPDGFQIDHLCRVRACANPAHLEAVTQAENILRSDAPNAIATRNQSCLRGHPFTPENTRIKPDGRRDCRVCARERARKVCPECGKTQSNIHKHLRAIHGVTP